MKEVLTLSQWTRAVKSRGQCERCGKTERLHAHHKDRDETNNVIENGECLCVWCHDDEHNQGGSLVAWDEAVRNPSEEARRRFSEASRSRKASDETRRKIGEAGRGRKPSDDDRHRKAEALRGRPISDEVRRKLSEAAKNRPPISDEARQKMCEAPGKKSAETRRKISEANHRRGPVSDETRRKLSEANRRRWQAVRESSETGPARGVE